MRREADRIQCKHSLTLGPQDIGVGVFDVHTDPTAEDVSHTTEQVLFGTKGSSSSAASAPSSSAAPTSNTALITPIDADDDATPADPADTADD